MQNWGPQSQAGSDGHNGWQQSFDLPGSSAQYDQNQAWTHQGQPSYPHLNQQEHATPGFFDSTFQPDDFLSEGIRRHSPDGQSFQNGPSHAGVGQHYSQAGQDVIDPAFQQIHPELYNQQVKGSTGNSNPQTHHVHGHSSQPNGQPQGRFAQHEFQYSAPEDSAYSSTVSQYVQARLGPELSRPGSHTPAQQFDPVTNTFTQPHGYPRPAQQPQQHYQSSQAFGATNSPHETLYQPRPQFQYQTTSQAYPSTNLEQSRRSPYMPTTDSQLYSQPQQVAPTPSGKLTAPTINPQFIPPPTRTRSPTPQSHPAEPPAKRKRVTKTLIEPSPPIVAAPPDQPTGKQSEIIDTLAAPVPTEEESRVIVQFGKRTKAAQVKYPSIKGLPYLVYDGSIKLPIPKSFDKLSPLVAFPARSGQPLVPESGSSLPCEVQGRFSSQYYPSPDKGGLDERRVEAKSLLDAYDQSMKALGKKQPKYTEYPHAFKEQLKSDEANKNKAGKRAKKELSEEVVRPPPVVSRPQDPVEAVVWEFTSIVTIGKFQERSSQLIASRVQQAGDFLINLRNEMNQAKVVADQATKNNTSDLPQVKQVFAQKKEMLYRALDTTVEHADDAVLDNLGGYQKLILSLVNILISAIKSSDFSGKLPKIVLELLTHFRMTKKIAETTNFDTVRKRLADKGDKEVKELVAEISANVKKVLKTVDGDVSTGYTGTSAASRAKSGTKGVPDAASSKRSRDDDVDSRSVKKVALESTTGGGSLSKKLAQPKISSQMASKLNPAKPVTSILPGKLRPVVKPVPKVDAAKANTTSSTIEEKLKTEFKKPVVKPELGKSVVPKVDARLSAAKTGSAPTASALSGIASLLDSINAPKLEPVPVVINEVPEPSSLETDGDKAKRLRKEARRKLRVTWKLEDDLVQVRVFHKDDGEDEGRAVNMIRDAADDHAEGMVLKQRGNAIEDDDDDDIPYVPWTEPAATDYSNLSSEARSKNYNTRAGDVGFSTEEQGRIATREQTELMALYTDHTDIPPTPKSPPHEIVESSLTKEGSVPKDSSKFREIHSRWIDTHSMNADSALFAATARMDMRVDANKRLDSIIGRVQSSPKHTAAGTRQQGAVQQAQAAQPLLDLPLAVGNAAEERLLAWLSSEKLRAWQDPNPIQPDSTKVYPQYNDPWLQKAANAVETTVKTFSGLPFPATTPPEWLMGYEEKVREWWFGYNKEMAAKQKKIDEDRARGEVEADTLRMAAAASAATQQQGNAQDWAAYYAQQQQSYAPYMAILQQMQGGQQPQGAQSAQQPQLPDNQLQTILSALHQPGQQPSQTQTAPQPPPANNPFAHINPNDPSYQQLMMLAQMTQQGSGQPIPPIAPPSASAERDWERNRWDGGQGSGTDSNDYSKDGKDANRKKKATLPPHKPANKALIGTKPCTFWQQGKCARGDQCTFRHD